jgi:uncharacterized membrane protein YfcA
VDLAPWQWLLLACGAFATGLSKTGVAGLGVLSVALFANALPARASTGALLPLLLCADVIGVGVYRKHASWPHLVRLFPWVVLGVGGGSLALGAASDRLVQRAIGAILLAMLGVHFWRRRRPPVGPEGIVLRSAATAPVGVLAGFATMVANAAGPVMVVYLLAMRLPKLVFVGTSAWFYLLVNAFKVPFSVGLGLISLRSLAVDAALLVPMVPGALLGPAILRRMDQRAFEGVVLVLTAAAALRLLA